MHRRDFVAASAAAVGLAALDTSRQALVAGESAAGQAGRLILELRKYRFADATKKNAYGHFLADAAVKAYNEVGIELVGVFRLMAGDNPELKLADDPLEIWLLLPHQTFDSVLAFESRLAADKKFQQAGEAILSAPKSDPAFLRYDTSLLYAFDGFQKVSAPAKTDARIFELRTYENPNQERALNKMKMFNSGEIPIFETVGMPGVFFGEAFAGADLPHLTYMIAHADSESIKKNWDGFRADANWKKLNAETEYKDNVSKIEHYFLRPMGASQI